MYTDPPARKHYCGWTLISGEVTKRAVFIPAVVEARDLYRPLEFPPHIVEQT